MPGTPVLHLTVGGSDRPVQYDLKAEWVDF